MTNGSLLLSLRQGKGWFDMAVFSQETRERVRKMHLLQDLWLILLSGLAIFSLLLSVLAVLPPKDRGVEIRDRITVSSSLINASDGGYLTEVSGSIKNTTGETLTLELLSVRVSAEESLSASVQMDKESILLPPRTEVPISMIAESTADYRYVGEVTVKLDGEEVFLRNPAGISLTAALLPIACTVLFAFLAVRAAKVRYYLWQEDRMKEAGES